MGLTRSSVGKEAVINYGHVLQDDLADLFAAALHQDDGAAGFLADLHGGVFITDVRADHGRGHVSIEAGGAGFAVDEGDGIAHPCGHAVIRGGKARLRAHKIAPAHAAI